MCSYAFVFLPFCFVRRGLLSAPVTIMRRSKLGPFLLSYSINGNSLKSSEPHSLKSCPVLLLFSFSESNTERSWTAWWSYRRTTEHSFWGGDFCTWRKPPWFSRSDSEVRLLGEFTDSCWRRNGRRKKRGNGRKRRGTLAFLLRWGRRTPCELQGQFPFLQQEFPVDAAEPAVWNITSWWLGHKMPWL